ncbi:MAG: HTH domain-containing protein [Candidatus Odinarchaeota archaeon]|nr:HTH domain-containing protein [Candidatus Odinarchaeota archaeon]
MEFERLEDALNTQHYGRRVKVKVQIAGFSNPKALPKKLVFEEDGVAVFDVDLSEEKNFDFLRVYLFGKRKEVLELARMKNRDVKGFVESNEQMNYRVLFLRSIPTIGKRIQIGQTVAAHLISREIPFSTKVKIIGRLVKDRGKNLTFLIYDIEELEETFENFKITEEDRVNFKKYFQENDATYVQIAPGMVGRENYEKSLQLILHSPPQIPNIYGNEIIRGCLRIVAFGDTKCYKSRAALQLVGEHYNFGDYVAIESGGRTGICWTIDTERRILIWGSLVLNDLGLVVLDGLDKLHVEEVKEMREALEQQRVVVRKSVQGEAPARTRIVGISNMPKNMEEYPYPCQALLDSKIFSKSYFVTRWDVYLPFSQADVDPELIVRAKPKGRQIPDEIFIRHVFWAWSRRPEDITYTDEAREKIVEESARIIREYSLSELPVVHNGFREVLTRLSVAYACLRHSTDETHEKVIVKPKHVEEAVKFYEKTLEMLKLREYKLDVEGRREIKIGEFLEIVNNLSKRQIDILNILKIGGKSSTELANILGVSDRTVKEDYKLLTKYGLITTKQGVGTQITTKGVKFLKILEAFTNVKLVKENFTISLIESISTLIKDADSISKKDMKNISEIVKKRFTNFTNAKLEEYTWESKKQLIFDYVDKNGPLERWKLENFAKGHGIPKEELDKIIGEGKREEKIEEYQYDMVIYYRKPRKPPKKGDDKNES